MNYCTATVRAAGAKNVHTARDWNGTVVATRRSAHVYRYAIARRIRTADGASIVIDRWSNSAKATGGRFAIPVTDAA